jgi:uncharacterized protein (TIGR00661 family)
LHNTNNFEMNIVIGICGIGNGHSLRQYEIISRLIKNNHKLVIYAFGQSYSFFKKNFKNIPIYEVFVPWIQSAIDGIDFEKTSLNKYNQSNKMISVNYDVMYKTKIYFKSHPDLIISDYEPISAQFAYATNTNLITIDQQSKFLGYCFPLLETYSREEEKSRLSLFFPKALKRFSVSFYKIPYIKDKNYDVQIVPPIIRYDIIKLNRTKQVSNIIIVYFSPYGPTKQSLNEIIEIFKKFTNKKFIIFNSNKIEYEENNISACYFNRKKFTSILGIADAVITTAGHTLISELVYLNIPILTIPLNTYDQHFCGHFVNQEHFGLNVNEISEDNISTFLNNLDFYRNQIKNSKCIFRDHNGIDFIINKLTNDKIII